MAQGSWITFPAVALRKAISELGQSHYISLATGFWYEWSLAIPAAYGIDLLNHTATFFDDGDAKITTSTWPQVCMDLEITDSGGQD